MKIAIAMETYNGAEYLLAQLDCFVAQSRQPEELIVIDACSTDNTLQILVNFAKVTPFRVITHCNERNYGYCGNFNQALLRSTGDLVFLSDQVDVRFPEKVERIAAIMEEGLDDDKRCCTYGWASVMTPDWPRSGKYGRLAFKSLISL